LKSKGKIEEASFDAVLATFTIKDGSIQFLVDIGDAYLHLWVK